MHAVRFSVVAGLALLVAGCNPSLEAPPGVLINCATNGICPDGLVCVRDVNACVRPGTTCVEQRDGGYFPATDGNVCTSEGEAGVCRSGACIRCGNGFVEEGETCDDGNLDPTDDCPINCLNARCGDGYVRAGVEECDDGNDSNDDACLTTCASNLCGDGYVNAATEQCDDQNDNENDGCSFCMASVWEPRIAFGLGSDGSAPATTGLANLSPLASTRAGLLYAGWQRKTGPASVIDLNPIERTVGGVFVVSAAANTVLPITRRDGALRGDQLPETGLARAIQLGLVTGMTTDARGNLYVTMVNYSLQAGSYLSFGAYVLFIDLEGNLSIVAGDEQRCETTAVPTSCGNLGRARDATFSDLSSVAFDRRGRLHIADGASVRLIDIDGRMKARAGRAAVKCAGGPCGDNGPADAATFVGPLAIAFDAEDNLYIADQGDRRIRRVSTTEVITTVYGTGADCTDWPGCDNGARLKHPVAIAVTPQYMYIADDQGDATNKAGAVIRRATLGTPNTQIVYGQDGNGAPCELQPCGDGQPPASARSSYIDGLAMLGDGRLAFTDVLARPEIPNVRAPARIRVIDFAANRVDNLAGRVGQERPQVGNLPTSHEAHIPLWTEDGRFIFAAGSRIFGIDAQTNHVTLVAGSDRCEFSSGKCIAEEKPADQFSFATIGDMDASDGSIYVADVDRQQVFAITANTVRHVFGTRCAVADACVPAADADARNAKVKAIGGISYRGGHLFVTDRATSVVWDATIGAGAAPTIGSGVYGSGGNGGAPGAASLRCPLDVLASTDGGVYVSDPDSCEIRVVRNNVISSVATVGTCVSNPQSLPDDEKCGRWDAAGGGVVRTPLSLTEDSQGVIASGTASVSRVASNTLTKIAGELPGMSPELLLEGADANTVRLAEVRIAARPGRELLIGSALDLTHVIRRFGPDGTLRLVAGDIDGSVTGGFPVAELFSPRAAARLSPSTVLLADSGLNAVRRIDTDRREVEPAIFAKYGPQLSAVAPVTARFSTPLIFTPDAIAVDAARLKVYLAESASGRLATVSTPDLADPTTWTAVANGALSGTRAGISSATSLALDAATGRLFVADEQQHAIYSLAPDTYAATVIAGTPPFVGFNGDDRKAIDALLDSPHGLAVSASGALYFADTGNNRVRRVTRSGSIETVMGTGLASSEGTGGPARTLPVEAPTSLAFDQYGNLLISAGPILRVVYADNDGEPIGTSIGGTLYNAREVPSQRDVIKCLTAAFSGRDGEIYIADACSGAVVLLERR